jgi:hypothetical protein
MKFEGAAGGDEILGRAENGNAAAADQFNKRNHALNHIPTSKQLDDDGKTRRRGTIFPVTYCPGLLNNRWC